MRTPLLLCPRCGRMGFTKRGIVHHRCDGTDGDGRGVLLEKRRLKAEEINIALNVAQGVLFHTAPPIEQLGLL